MCLAITWSCSGASSSFQYLQTAWVCGFSYSFKSSLLSTNHIFSKPLLCLRCSDTDATSIWGYGMPGDSISVVASGGLQEKWAPTQIDATGLWFISLLNAQPATTVPTTFTFTSQQTGDEVLLQDVLFGDVHLCGGQSNMQFSVAGGLNATAEIEAANDYPLIRVFTVGQKTNSSTPLQELATIEQPWSVASAKSIGDGNWSAFSAVCWFTYRAVHDALGSKVPQGLISNNWGGTPIQHWVSPQVLVGCGHNAPDSQLWNAMIAPYTVGPMRIRTAIWYQGIRALCFQCTVMLMCAITSALRRLLK